MKKISLEIFKENSLGEENSNHVRGFPTRKQTILFIYVLFYHTATHREILLYQPAIRLYLPFSK